MLIPIIISGGTGSRLWPVSREAHPKPFIKLDNQSLLQRTFARATSLVGVTDILTVTNRDYYFKTRDEYADSLSITQGICSRFLLEPQARNTAPAIALAALQIEALYGKDAVMLVMAADHLIEDQNLFTNTVQQAYQLAQKDHLITFGIMPTKPETGYGYIECGDSYELNSFNVKRFVEKPDLALAQSYVASKQYLWNSGLFCFKATNILKQLKALAPELYQQALICWEKTQQENDINSEMLELDLATFSQLEDISIDYAVMEKAENVLVIPGNFGWNDIGSWEALSQLGELDDQGNQAIGETVLINVNNTFIRSENRLVAAMGIDNLFIVDTPDALLVGHKDCAQDVKKVVSHLKSVQHESYKLHRTVNRPWGSYTVLEEGTGFKIKRIEVRPGAKLSLQMHKHRSEHWIVVSGIATVTNGENILVLQMNESTYIPMGNLHRLENSGTDDLVLIEVQSGAYLGEDDIVRFEDQYGRVSESV
jgi:mannose-1-phosphate guanylyltransferase